MRIIVVDDEPVVAQTLGAILGHSGYEVEIFLRPDEALQCILNLPADLLLTDMCMPSMNGLELALQVVQQRPTTQVLILSGRIDHPSEVSEADRSRFRLIYKPVGPAALLEIIADITSTLHVPENMTAPDRVPRAAM